MKLWTELLPKHPAIAKRQPCAPGQCYSIEPAQPTIRTISATAGSPAAQTLGAVRLVLVPQPKEVPLQHIRCLYITKTVRPDSALAHRRSGPS
jgi:hypothetical protein